MRPVTTRYLVFALAAGLASPVTALAHGVAHLHVGVDHHHANPTWAHESGARLVLESADHGADHTALHGQDGGRPSSSTLLHVSAVTVLPSPLKANALIVSAPMRDPPPSQITASDQPRAPPRS